jgi:hypothetical protein
MGLGSGIRKKPIPDPGSREKGNGSATLESSTKQNEIPSCTWSEELAVTCYIRQSQMHLVRGTLLYGTGTYLAREANCAWLDLRCPAVRYLVRGTLLWS